MVDFTLIKLYFVQTTVFGDDLASRNHYTGALYAVTRALLHRPGTHWDLEPANRTCRIVRNLCTSRLSQELCGTKERTKNVSVSS